MMTRSSRYGRRSFVATLGSLGLTIPSAWAGQRDGAQGAPSAASDFAMDWLDQMKGQHKQLYDLGGHSLGEDPRPLRFARNFLDTFQDTYRLAFPAINTAVGISGPAFPMNASDRLWAKYKLGERSQIIDPTTKQPAVRNVFLTGGDVSITALQARGTVFWQCNVALGIVAQGLADAFQMPVAEVRADLRAGLNPGVKLMPSHVMALALAQEHGFTYMKP